jgi:hypothetical protein
MFRAINVGAYNGQGAEQYRAAPLPAQPTHQQEQSTPFSYSQNNDNFFSKVLVV